MPLPFIAPYYQLAPPHAAYSLVCIALCSRSSGPIPAFLGPFSSASRIIGPHGSIPVGIIAYVAGKTSQQVASHQVAVSPMADFRVLAQTFYPTPTL